MAPVVSAKFTSDQSVTLFMVRARWRWRWRWGGACGLVGGGGGAVALATARSPPLLLRATPPHLLLLVVPQGTNNENAGTKTELKFFDSTGALQLQVTGTGLFVEKRVLADGQGQTLALMSKNPISMAKWAIKDVEGNQLAKTSTVAGARGGGGGGGARARCGGPSPTLPALTLPPGVLARACLAKYGLEVRVPSRGSKVAYMVAPDSSDMSRVVM